MTEVDYRFRHKIGDALYALTMAFDGFPEETVMYPIVKRTERYVYVHRIRWDSESRLVRLSVGDLERDGCAWNQANRMMLHTRPMTHWPLMPADVRDPGQQAIGRA